MPDHRKKLVSYQISCGVASGFIQRYILANPDNTWQQLKEQLSVRFSHVTDRQMALSLLRSVKQRTGKTIQVFAEHILSLAEMAYLNQGGDAVGHQLIDIFVDRIINDSLEMKILRDQPHTLQGVLKLPLLNKTLGLGCKCHTVMHSLVVLSPWKLSPPEVKSLDVKISIGTVE